MSCKSYTDPRNYEFEIWMSETNQPTNQKAN
jgi:hypothetical protein